MVAFELTSRGGHWTLPIFLIGLLGGSCATTPPGPGSAPPPASPASGQGAAGLCERPDPLFGPVFVAPEVYAVRTGVMASTFSGLGPTTKQRPLEECGIPAVLKRLVTLKCDDGSNPYGGSLGAAERTRAGSFGPGGRCDSILDRYDVPCPEGVYRVFTDCYVCVRPLKSAMIDQ